MAVETNIQVEKTKSPRPRPADAKYGFGKYFSDHVFMCDYTASTDWQNPRIVPYQPLSLDPGASVLHYGQAIFEGMKAFRGADGRIRLFRPEMNWARMQASAERLCMNFIELNLFLQSIIKLVQTDIDWVPSEGGTALYLRPTLIGTEAFLGVRPSESFLYYVMTCPVSAYYGDNMDSVKIWVEDKYTRAAPGGIGSAKAGGNYAASLLAAVEAKKRGYAQVLWLDACQKKFIEEVGTMNVFFKIGDKVVTPSLSGTILPGVMRDSVLQLLDMKGIAVEQRPITIDEVRTAHAKGELKEVFGTGTAASISPVGHLGFENETLEINGGKMGALASDLFKTIQDIQYGRSPDKLGWTMDITP